MCGLLAAATSAAVAQDRWSILTTAGEEQVVTPDGIGEGVIRWRGIDRLTRTTPTDQLLTLTANLPRWPDPDAFDAWASDNSVLVDLVDGQRLLGWLEPDAPNESIGVRLGPVTVRTIPLDRVALIVLGPTLADTAYRRPDRTDDTVLLRNGDRLTGFLISVTHAQTAEADDTIDPEARDRLELTIDTDSGPDGGPVTLDLSRVRAIELANPSEPMRGQRVDLRNGSIVAAARVYEGARDLRSIILEPEGEPDSPAALLPVALRDVAGLTPAPGALVALAAIPSPTVRPAPGQRWTPGPRVGAIHESTGGLAPITLPGPMTVAWPVPANASSFTAVLDRARDAGPWTDAEVEIAALTGPDSRTVLLTRRVTADTEPERLWTALPPGTTALEITLHPGERGPAQDRVTLDRAAIILD